MVVVEGKSRTNNVFLPYTVTKKLDLQKFLIMQHKRKTKKKIRIR